MHMVEQRMPKGNPAVGILREHVIIGYFISEFGQDQVDVPERGNERGYDLTLCGHELSIKTRTKDGAFKVLWTVDTESVSREKGFRPEHDIFLINIFWMECKPSVFYIPLSVQQEVFDDIGYEDYISVRTGTNHRGIEVKGSTVKLLKAHSDTMNVSVDWTPKDREYPPPWEEWEGYWANL